jgi:hypothetical protein
MCASLKTDEMMTGFVVIGTWTQKHLRGEKAVLHRIHRQLPFILLKERAIDEAAHRPSEVDDEVTVASA